MAHLKPAEGDVIIAVDFGTTRTAVAYTVAGWTSSLIGVLPPGKAGSFVQGDLKTPTSLLFEEGSVTFGCDAEQRFAERGSDHEGWQLFQHFKMELHKPFEADPLVDSLGGLGSMRLSKLIEASLRVIKDNTIEHLTNTKVLINGNPHEVFWVLTLPAIWSPHAKAMMRTAAYNAGMLPTENSSRLMLALEPECAAISCEMRGEGIKFLVADCGGGTLDITTHLVVQSSPLQLKEIQAPCGGPFGATRVDEEFLMFFSSFIGPQRYQRLRRECSVEFFELFRVWEEKKQQFGFDPQDDDYTILNLASVLAALSLTISDLVLMIEMWNRGNAIGTNVPIVQSKKKIYLPYWLVRSFFKDTISGILQQVALAAAGCSGLHYIVLSGGFGRCRMLKEELKKQFADSSVHVICSKDPDLSIVKGAALFGSTGGGYVTSRKSYYTFGVACHSRYKSENEKHSENKGEIFIGRDGRERLHIFRVHGRVGDDLACDAQIRRSYRPMTDDQEIILFEILVTQERDVFLCDEPGVQRLCKAEIHLGKMMDLPLNDRRVWVQFHFGTPEVRCYFYDSTGVNELRNVRVDFEFFDTI